MELRNESLLDEFRREGKCEFCGRLTLNGTDPAHIFARGHGGEVTHPWNLVSLCRECHQASHDGNHPTHTDLLAVSAARHGILQDDIHSMVCLVRRLDKGEFAFLNFHHRDSRARKPGKGEPGRESRGDLWRNCLSRSRAKKAKKSTIG